MPKYTITMDGKKYTVTADSEDDAIAALTMPEDTQQSPTTLNQAKGLLQSLQLGGVGIEQGVQHVGDALFKALHLPEVPEYLEGGRTPVSTIDTLRKQRDANLRGNVGAGLLGNVLEALPSAVATLPLASAGVVGHAPKVLTGLSALAGGAAGIGGTVLTNNPTFGDYLRNAAIGTGTGYLFGRSAAPTALKTGLEGALQGYLLPHTTNSELYQNTAIGGAAGGVLGGAMKAGGDSYDTLRRVFAKEPNAQALVERILKLKAGENATLQDIANIALSNKYAIDYGMADRGSHELSDLWHPSSYYTQDPIDRTAVAYARRAGGSTFEQLDSSNTPHIFNYLTHLPEHYNLGETSSSFYDKFIRSAEGAKGVGPDAIERALASGEGKMDVDAVMEYLKHRVETKFSYEPYHNTVSRIYNRRKAILDAAGAARVAQSKGEPLTYEQKLAIDQADKLANPKEWADTSSSIEASLNDAPGDLKNSLGGTDRRVIEAYIDQATGGDTTTMGEFAKAEQQFKGFKAIQQQLQNMENLTAKYVGNTGADLQRFEPPTSAILTNDLNDLSTLTKYGTLQLDPGALQGFNDLRKVLYRHEQSMPSSVTDEEFKINPRFNAVARIGGSAIGNEAGWAAARFIPLLGGRNTEQNLVRIMTQPKEYSRLLKQVADRQLYSDAQRSVLAEKLPALFGNLAAQWSNYYGRLEW